MPAAALVVRGLEARIPDLEHWIQQADCWIRHADSWREALDRIDGVDFCVVDGEMEGADAFGAEVAPHRVIWVGRDDGRERPDRVTVADGPELRSALRHLRRAIDVEQRFARLRDDTMAHGRLDALVGRSDETHRLWSRMIHCAGKRGPVLVVGAPGTGKRLVAETLHRIGPRAERRLVRVDCRNASELGSLAGALEEARGGTLVLAHVDSASVDEDALAKVWARESTAPCLVATAIAAPDEAAGGPFWSGFAHRLHVGPLASRPDDIDALAEHFLAELCGTISGSARSPFRASPSRPTRSRCGSAPRSRPSSGISSSRRSLRVAGASRKRRACSGSA